MKKSYLVLGIVALFVAGIVLGDVGDPADLLARIMGLESKVQSLDSRLSVLEGLHGIEPPIDLCDGVVCQDSSLSCFDGFQARCSNSCNDGLCSNCAPSCAGHENPCKDVVCQDSSLTCFDGYLASCSNLCSNGVCGSCIPSCAGHEDPCKGINCIDTVRTCPDGFISKCGNSCSNGICSVCVPSCVSHQTITYERVTYNYKVMSGNDDAYEHIGNMYLNSVTVDVGNDYYGGFRFNNIQIPKGSVIEDARLSLAYNWASGTSNLLLYGDNSDNAKQFQSINKDITVRAKTKGVTWNNLVKSSWGTYQTSPNISSIIQEIINRTNWNSGNSIVITGHYLSGGLWEAISYEGTSWNYGLYGAKLEIKTLIPSVPINNTPPPEQNVSDKKIVIVQIDDASPLWGQDTTIEVVQAFMSNNLSLVIDLFPSGLTSNPSYAEAVKTWQLSPYIEVAQGTDGVATGSLSYSELVNNLNRGLSEFVSAGLQKPETVTCHISNGDTNTLDAVRDSQYDLFACLLEGSYRNNSPFTVGIGYGGERHGDFILRDFGMMGTTQPIKTADEFKSAADIMITKRGYAYFVGHFSDYTTSRIAYLISQLNLLRSEGYIFMTAKQYYDFKNTGG